MFAIDPQQELFTKLKLSIENLGVKVFDALPPKDEKYPFTHLGEFQQIDDANKTAVFGNVYGAINVWHTAKNRGDLSELLLKIKTVCREIEHTQNFAWFVVNINQRIITDTTTNQPLLHAILNVEWRFS